MGREIRRVPAGWEHPRDSRGHLKPLYDRDFETAARKWLDEAIAWDNGTHPDLTAEWLSTNGKSPKDENPFFWMWSGGPPDAEYHRPRWTDEERTHFQLYETVTEGTPLSPVFATLDDLVDWMVSDGGYDGPRSRAAAESFAKGGWAPSLVMSLGDDGSGFIADGIDGLHALNQSQAK